jgi:hypothetical protein
MQTDPFRHPAVIGSQQKVSSLANKGKMRKGETEIGRKGEREKMRRKVNSFSHFPLFSQYQFPLFSPSPAPVSLITPKRKAVTKAPPRRPCTSLA